MEIIFWQMGSGRSQHTASTTQRAAHVGGLGFDLHAAPAARGLSLGEVTASSLGINVRTTQRKIL